MLNKISQNQIYNYPTSFRANSCNDSNKITYSQIDSKEYMSSDISSASKAYGMALVNQNQNVIPQMSLANFVNYLEKKGMIEGKDFEIDSSFTLGNSVLILKDKNGNENLVIHYDNGNHDSWSGYEINEYKNGQIAKTISRNQQGKMIDICKYYKNDDDKGKFIDEYLSHKTTPREYEKYLKDNNIKYKIEYTGDKENNRSVHISILNEKNKETDNLWFYYGKHKFDEQAYWVSKSNYNEQGQEYRRVCYNRNNVEIVTYMNYLGE